VGGEFHETATKLGIEKPLPIVATRCCSRENSLEAPSSSFSRHSSDDAQKDRGVVVAAAMGKIAVAHTLESSENAATMPEHDDKVLVSGGESEKQNS